MLTRQLHGVGTIIRFCHYIEFFLQQHHFYGRAYKRVIIYYQGCIHPYSHDVQFDVGSEDSHG
ncbi:hypothetical protein GCM10009091_03120 [Pseudomonas brenneri]|nr:hypothetical protein GCM10009091_03120 [Pseudomonas brenneri]